MTFERRPKGGEHIGYASMWRKIILGRRTAMRSPLNSSTDSLRISRRLCGLRIVSDWQVCRRQKTER